MLELLTPTQTFIVAAIALLYVVPAVMVYNIIRDSYEASGEHKRFNDFTKDEKECIYIPVLNLVMASAWFIGFIEGAIDYWFYIKEATDLPLPKRIIEFIKGIDSMFK